MDEIIELYYFIFVFFVSLITTYSLVPLCIRLAHVIGAIDYQSKRRINTKPTPRCGGIAIFIGLHAGLLSYVIGVNYFGWNIDDLYSLDRIDWLMLYVGIVLIYCVGLADDIIQLGSLTKLLGQATGVSIVYFSGVSIGAMSVFDSSSVMSLGWLDFPITIIYLIAFINIINLIDGVDGLCAGIVAIIAITFTYLMFQRSSFTLAFVCVALFAVCLAFLKYNFFPAKIFMGDSGSHLLGLLVGIVSVLGVVRAQNAIFFVIPIIFAAIPVFDTLASICRRLLKRQSVMQGDLEHIHHKLLRKGLSQKRTVAILWLSTAIFCGLGCVLSYENVTLSLVITLALSALLFAILFKLGAFRPVLSRFYLNNSEKPRKDNSKEIH